MKRLLLSLLLTLGSLVACGKGSVQPTSIVAATATATQPGLGTPQPPQTVKIAASDGLQIVGLFYPSILSGSQAPAALLLHQYGSNKHELQDFIPSLINEGYSVLAVDMRGFGDTGGKEDWKLAETDVATFLTWLRDQPSIDGKRIAIIGASIGADLALRGCAKDKQCHVAVALSPEDLGATTEETVKKVDTNKSVLLAAGLFDTESSKAVSKLSAMAWGNVSVRLYNGSAHGVNLLYAIEDLWSTIIQWLRTYNV